MWETGNKNLIKMTEGDWGVDLPITIDGTQLSENDKVLLTLKTAVNGEVILTKTFENITENMIRLNLTEEETALLPVGDYAYSLDWFQSGVFLCNIIPSAVFKVVDKA